MPTYQQIQLVDQNGNVIAGGGASATPLPTLIADPTTPTQRAAVQAFHNADNQTPPAAGFALLTGGVALVQNPTGTQDRQRGTGIDNISGLGVATSAQQFAMQISITLTQIVTANAAAQTVTVSATSGSYLGVPWSIQPGTILSVDLGLATAESVYVVSVPAAGQVRGIFLQNHANGAAVIAFAFNQERDAAGELDGATGSGTAVAAGYEYNGGGPGGANFDRERNVQGKGIASGALTTATAGQSSLLFTAAPTGLQPGQPLYLAQSATNLLTGGATEVVYVHRSYVLGSTTVPLTSAIQNAGHTTALWDAYTIVGPQGVILPTGVGLESDVVLDPTTGLYGEDFAATQDANPGKNVPLEALGLWNGATIDRARSSSAANPGILLVAIADPLTGGAQTRVGNPGDNDAGNAGAVAQSYLRAWNGASYDRIRVDPNATGVLRTTTGGATTVAIAAGAAANTTVKASAGRLSRVLVTASGANAMQITDGAAGTIIGILPANAAVGTVAVFDLPAANSIVAVGNAGNPAVTVGFY